MEVWPVTVFRAKEYRTMCCSKSWLAPLASVILAAAVIGCGEAAPAKKETPKAGEKKDEKKAAVEQKDLKLSAADQALADAQGVCPVSDEKLGEMGTPYKVTLSDGKVVFTCCKQCEPKLKADPAKYLAKLNKPKGAAAN